MRGNSRARLRHRRDAELDALAVGKAMDLLALETHLRPGGPHDAQIAFIVVDLPAALPPSSETISPSAIS